MADRVAVWSGSFRIFGVDVKCHTLDDGTRIVDAEDFERLLASMLAPDNGADLGDLIGFNQWRAARSEGPEPTEGTQEGTRG